MEKEKIYSVTYTAYDGELYSENRIYADKDEAVSEFNSYCVTIVNDLRGGNEDEEYDLEDCKQFIEDNTTKMPNGDLFFSTHYFNNEYQVSFQVFVLVDGEFLLASLAD